jgi:hypothetical protein
LTCEQHISLTYEYRLDTANLRWWVIAKLHPNRL